MSPNIESVEMNGDIKSDESSKSQMCAKVKSIKTNVKPGGSRESQPGAMGKPKIKLLWPYACRHAKVVQAQISADAGSGGTHLFMLESGSPSEESDVIVPTSIV